MIKTLMNRTLILIIMEKFVRYIHACSNRDKRHVIEKNNWPLNITCLNCVSVFHHDSGLLEKQQDIFQNLVNWDSWSNLWSNHRLKEIKIDVEYYHHPHYLSSCIGIYWVNCDSCLQSIADACIMFSFLSKHFAQQNFVCMYEILSSSTILCRLAVIAKITC